MSEAMSTWEMEEHLIRTLGVLEVDRRVHRVCPYLRTERKCQRCPMKFREMIDGEEETYQHGCYGLALEAIAYANGAIHPREKAATAQPRQDEGSES